MAFCSQAFYNIEIYENGDIYNCCPHFQNYIPIGNLFKMPFDEIWNSKRVQSYRENLLNGDFSMCNPMCNKINNDEEIKEDCKSFMEKYPRFFAISSDNICNVKCRFCREKNLKSELSDKEFIKKIDSVFLPIMKDAEFIRFGCSGEPFASTKEKELISRIINKYPQIKVQIFTNGLLANEQTLKKYKLYGKIDSLTVSIHAATKKTYEKIVRGGNFELLVKNLELYSDLKQNGLLNALDFVFVVYKENYTEIPDFIEFAKNTTPILYSGLSEKI